MSIHPSCKSGETNAGGGGLRERLRDVLINILFHHATLNKLCTKTLISPEIKEINSLEREKWITTVCHCHRFSVHGLREKTPTPSKFLLFMSYIPYIVFTHIRPRTSLFYFFRPLSCPILI